jgi:hypothetical protein
MKQLMWKREGFLDSLTVCRYMKVVILKYKTVNLHERLIEKPNFIYPLKRQFLKGVVTCMLCFKV